MSSNSRPCWTVRTAELRRGFTLTEAVVAFCVAVILFSMAYRMIFYQRKAVEYGERIDCLRATRMILARVGRDLAGAARVVGPAYDTSGYELRIMDEEYRPIRYRLEDEAGKVLVTPAEVARAEKVLLVRLVGGASAEDAERIGKLERLDHVEFTRLGRNMVGVSVQLRPQDKQEAADPSLFFSTVLSTGRRID